MSDKKKLALIDRILGDAWEWQIGHETHDGYFEGVLNAISTVIGWEATGNA